MAGRCNCGCVCAPKSAGVFTGHIHWCEDFEVLIRRAQKAKNPDGVVRAFFMAQGLR
jgi:hypothetical protein